MNTYLLLQNQSHFLKNKQKRIILIMMFFGASCFLHRATYNTVHGLSQHYMPPVNKFKLIAFKTGLYCCTKATSGKIIHWEYMSDNL